jgi:stage V sporulation protein B
VTDKTIASRAGLGGVAVLFAKVFFILSGLVQQALLPRFIGQAGYGALALVLAPANIVNNVVVAGSTQSASRAVAGAPGHELEAQRAAMRVHVPLAIAAGLAFAAAAVPISRFEHAPHIAAPLLAMSAVVLFYGLYAPLIGVLNGRGLFVRQATLDVVFATIRTAGLLGVGLFFVQRGLSGALGSTLGFSCAAAIIAGVAATMVRRSGDTTGTRSTRTPASAILGGSRYLLVLLPLALAQLFTNALMQLDIMLLGRFLSEGAHTTGLVGDAAEKATDEWVAGYRACQLFAFLPYQLLLSLTQVLFPMLARARVEESKDAVRDYVARGARLGAIAMGMMVAVIAGMPETAIRFAYNADIASRGAPALRVLALGQGGFAMLGIGCTVLSSLGRERVSAVITACAAATAVIACALVVPGHAFGAAQLEATAWCMAVVLAVALVVCAVVVVRVAGAFVPAATAVRVAVALVVTVAVGAHVNAMPRALAPVVAVALAGLYLVLLALSREIRRADVTWVLAAIPRGRRNGTM